MSKLLAKIISRRHLYIDLVKSYEKVVPIDPFHIVISLSNRSSIEKSIKPFLKMKGQIAF